MGLMGALVVCSFGAHANSDLQALKESYKRPTTVPVSKENPGTREKIALGKALFFDPRLSGSGSIACSTCHNPGLGWQDGLPKGIGHFGTVLDRRTPSILDVAYGEPFFWDGRAENLEQQAKGPMTSTREMSGTGAELRIASIPAYASAFARVFPDHPISLDTIAAAIAAYERTVLSGVTPFDRWVNGDDHAISGSAVRGFKVFNGKGNCAACHQGWRLTDDGFHDIGMPDADRGRAAIAPGIEQLEHAFKTPTLRNVALRAPYMHDGSVPTLSAVIDHYDTGFVERNSLDSNMHRLNLSAGEKRDLLAFMATLTSVDAPVTIPVLPQ